MKNKILRALFTRRFWAEVSLLIQAAIVPMLPFLIIVAVVFTGAFAGHLAMENHARYMELKREREELISELTAYRVMAEWDRFEEERRGK